MQIILIKTHKISLGEQLESIFSRYLPRIKEQNIVVITSKIVSLCEKAVMPKNNKDKYQLICEEADAMIENQQSADKEMTITIKNGILIPSAGIDESNADNLYILYPRNPFQTAHRIWSFLRKEYHIKELGVLITDSHTTPLRRGVTGIALAWCGFQPLHSYVGKPDLFEKPLRFTHTNIVDGLAAAAVLCMGEGNEQTPIALIDNAPKIVFCDTPPSTEELRHFQIPLDEDLYAPLLKSVQWRFKKTSS